MTTEDMIERIAEIELEAQGRYIAALEEVGESVYWSDLAATELHEQYLDDGDLAELERLRFALNVAHHEPTD